MKAFDLIFEQLDDEEDVNKEKDVEEATAEDDSSHKETITKRDEVIQRGNIDQLIRDYNEAGRRFVALTCTTTYKMLKSSSEKTKNIKLLAKELTDKSDSTEPFLKDINNINERKHIDAGACTLALAIKYKEANKDKKSPYSAKNTKEATMLASRYKKAFPKYYQKAYNLLSDAYTRGISEAQKDLRDGKDLVDPITGEKVNKPLMAWTASKLQGMNKLITNDKWDVISLGPKLILMTFNMLTSNTAKNIYSNIYKFGKAIAQNLKTQEEAAETQDNKELFNCDVDTLRNEFDEIVKRHSETKDEVDKSEEQDFTEQEGN